MSPDLRDKIAQSIVLMMDCRQDADTVHRLILAFCEQSYTEGVMAGLDTAGTIIERHSGVLA